jgi:hypothetical protein
MTRCALHAGLLAALLSGGAAAGGGAGPAVAPVATAASAGASRPQGGPAAPATRAEVDRAHQDQRQLCQALALAAVRKECLRQADRSRDQALARLQAAEAAAQPASGSQR